MPSVAVSPKAVVLLLFVAPIVYGHGSVWSLFCCAVFRVLSSFAIILLGKRGGCLVYLFS